MTKRFLTILNKREGGGYGKKGWDCWGSGYTL